MTAETIHFRPDPEIRRALTILGADAEGANRSKIVRAAILAAAEEAERAAFQAECERLAASEADRAAIRELQADLDPFRAW